MSKRTFILFGVFALLPSLAWAQGVIPNSVTTTTFLNPGTVSSANQPLQKTGLEAMQQNDNDGNEAILIAAGFLIAGFGFCSAEDYPQCALYLAAAWLGAKVVASILKSRNSNQQMYNDVTVGPPTTSPPCVSPCVPTAGTTPTTLGPGSPDGYGNPAWNGYKTNMAKLTKMGVTVSPKGVVTLPDGKTINVGDMSPSALQNAGFSNSQIGAFNSAAAEIRAKAAAATKGADANSDLLGDTVGGGSSGSNARGGVAATGIPSAPRVAVDRNPAQIAGMSRDLNGEPIGVSADDVWKMMNRRYNLEEKNGLFLPTGP